MTCLSELQAFGKLADADLNGVKLANHPIAFDLTPLMPEAQYIGM